MAKRIIYRSAISGEIVTAAYAKENPTTTVKETITIQPKKKEKK